MMRLSEGGEGNCLLSSLPACTHVMHARMYLHSRLHAIIGCWRDRPHSIAVRRACNRSIITEDFSIPAPRIEKHKSPCHMSREKDREQTRHNRNSVDIVLLDTVCPCWPPCWS